MGNVNNPAAAAAVTLATIPGSTYDDAQDMQNIFHSSGWVEGGAITDDGDGTITVAAGNGAIRATDSSVAEILFFDWAAESGVLVDLPDNDISWVYAEYNSGAPRVVAVTTERTDFQTNVLLAVISRVGTDLHMSLEDTHLVGDHANNMIRRLKATAQWARASGGTLSETGTRNIALTAGTFWRGLLEFATGAFDSSGADRYTLYRGDGSGGFTVVTGEATINNTQYDDGAGALATLSTNRYGVFWVYLESDGDVAVIFGVGNYTLDDAQDAQPPASVPEPIMVHGFLAGKIVIKKNDAAFTEILSSFETAFAGSLAADHGGLAGLADDDHTQYILVDGTRALTAKLTQGDGGTETQITSKATTVVLNTTSGQITTHNESIAAGATVTFTVTNSTVAAVDAVIVGHGSGGAANSYIVTVEAISAGSFDISIHNQTAGALGEVLVINFVVFGGSAT